MIPASRPGGACAGDKFSSLTEAQAWLTGVPQAIGSLSQAELTGAILGVESAYDQFPELLAHCPRRALFRSIRAAAAALPDAGATTLLLLCAAAEPSDAASLAGLFERAAHACGGALLLSLVRLFRRYRTLGWAEVGPALAVLIADGAGAATIGEILSEILGGIAVSPEGAAELGRVLAPLLLAEPASAINPAALAGAAAGARRHLTAAAGGEERMQRNPLLLLAGRLRARLQPAARPPGAVRPAWPSGETGFPWFLAQWPDVAIEVPASQLYTRYAELGADGVLRAERHAAGVFCHGPCLNLPAGRYRVRITGAAAAGAKYGVRVLHARDAHGPAPACEQHYVRDSRIVGTIADLAFASDIELRGFEIVVAVTSPSAAFAIAAVTIIADRLRPDPES